MKNKNLNKVGFVGFGEINSPKELVNDKCNSALKELELLGLEIVRTEVVTDDPEGNDVRRALADLKGSVFNVLVICLAGWIPSHAVIAITEEFRNTPMVLWGLAGDMEGGRIVTLAAQAGTTALRKVFTDLGYRFIYVFNIINKPSPIKRIEDFIIAAGSTSAIRHTKIGMLGFRDMKLYNTLYEGISLKATLGVDVEFFEMLEMVQLSENIEKKQIENIFQKIKQKWEFLNPVDDDFIRKGIGYYLGIKKLAEKNNYDAISLKDVDGMKRILHFPPALIFMLLSDEMKLCTIPENDVMGATTQLIIKLITGQCAAYFEFYEFFEGSVLMGVPDYVPSEIVNGKVKVTRAAFGEISGGLLNISTVKTGRLTLARLSNTADRYTMHICTGEGKLRSWEEAGWDRPAPQLPSLEVYLDSPMEEFTQKISGQHYILAYGDHVRALSDFCYLNKIAIV